MSLGVYTASVMTRRRRRRRSRNARCFYTYTENLSIRNFKTEP